MDSFSLMLMILLPLVIAILCVFCQPLRLLPKLHDLLTSLDSTKTWHVIMCSPKGCNISHCDFFYALLLVFLSFCSVLFVLLLG